MNNDDYMGEFSLKDRGKMFDAEFKDQRDDYQKRSELRNQISLKFHSSEVQEFIMKFTKDVLKASKINPSELIENASGELRHADEMVEKMLAEMLTRSKIKI